MALQRPINYSIDFNVFSVCGRYIQIPVTKEVPWLTWLNYQGLLEGKQQDKASIHLESPSLCETELSCPACGLCLPELAGEKSFSSTKISCVHPSTGFPVSEKRKSRLGWVILFVFCCSDKHHDQRQLKKGGSFHLTLPGHSLSWREVWTGIQGRILKQKPS